MIRGMDRDYSTREVLRLAGLTYRQLDYLCRTGRVPGQESGPGSGGQRRFTQAALEEVMRIQRARRLAEFVEDLTGEQLAALEALLASLPDSERVA